MQNLELRLANSPIMKKLSPEYYRPFPLFQPVGNPHTTVAFSICSETRELALRLPYILNTGNSRLYFNAELDTLFFSNTINKRHKDSQCTPDVFTRFARISDMRRLQRLAIGDLYLSFLCLRIPNPTGGPYFDGPTFRRLSGLEEMIVVFEGFERKEYQDILSRCMRRKSPHCELCSDSRRMVGDIRGWKFPTLAQFGERWREKNKGLNLDEKALEEEYGRVLWSSSHWMYTWQSLAEWMWRDIHGLDWRTVMNKVDYDIAVEELFSD